MVRDVSGMLHTPEVTLLGVRLDNRLVFNHNTDELGKKTGRQVNVLKRLYHHISQDVRMTVFRAFILSEQLSVSPSNMAPLLSIKH